MGGLYRRHVRKNKHTIFVPNWKKKKTYKKKLFNAKIYALVIRCNLVKIRVITRVPRNTCFLLWKNNTSKWQTDGWQRNGPQVLTCVSRGGHIKPTKLWQMNILTSETYLSLPVSLFEMQRQVCVCKSSFSWEYRDCMDIIKCNFKCV